MASPPRVRAQTAEPRLVVLISVDQLRADFTTQFTGHFCDGGFARLRRLGASFENATLSYGASATGPGHATLATGRIPRHHGIVANKWFLDASATTSRHAVDDPNCQMVGLPPGTSGGGKSAWQLIGATVGDELKRRDPRSRVFSVSLKDRTAIYMAGKGADGVFWWDKRAGGDFVSSTYYVRRLPAYVEDFNRNKLADGYGGATWDMLLDSNAYVGCIPVRAEWLDGVLPYGLHFPHVLPPADYDPRGLYYYCVYGSPFGNDMVLEMAKRILVNERLGADGIPDLLCIGLSSNDVVGHLFGPDSPEIMDMTVRTDRQLAGLLDLLDREVGLGSCLIVLTADHGVTMPGAVARLKGLDGGRAEIVKACGRLNAMLRERFGPLANGREYVSGQQIPWVYFDRAFLRLDEDRRGEILRTAAEFFGSVPGVADVFRADELIGPEPPPDDRAHYLAWRSFHPERSGELFLRLAPYHYYASGEFAGHSPGLPTDLEIPVMIAGPGVRPGPYFRPVRLCDVAPTVAELVGVRLSDCSDGRVLREALATTVPQ
ncbi:MAG: alkaline phosphatase family protein [Phycisphaerales bacterium]|nr:MAG: alkaline phosphatase family protein [Phycisphaerales bacterium]